MKLRKYAVLIIAVVLLAVLCFAVACEKHEHSYSWEETTAPTCEGQGVETGTCECGHVTTRPIPALGHDWGEYVVTEIPTADSVGTVTAICSADPSHKHNASLPVLSNPAYEIIPDGKDYNVEYKYNIVDEITGVEGQDVSFIICVHVHNYEWETVVEATCLAEGKKQGTCSHELCGDVIEDVIPKLDHVWNAPVIVVAPTAETEGSAVVTCEHDKDGEHTREYVLPSIHTAWNNHAVEDDPKECLYTGYVGSVDENDSDILHYVMTVYDPFQGYDCGPQNLEISIEVSLTNHVHVYGEYEVEKMPTGNSTGSAVAHCLIVPEHTHSVSLPAFNNTFAASNNYSYEIVDGIVNWSIVRTGYDDTSMTFVGSYELASSIAIKTSTFPTSTWSEEYNDGDTISIKVGDFASTMVIVTPLNGKSSRNINVTCVDDDGKVVNTYLDWFVSYANVDQGVTVDYTFFDDGHTLYIKDYCPNVHYITIDAGNGLASTFKIEPIYSAPSGSGANALKPQVYNTKQEAWNNVSDAQKVYVGADLIVAAGSGIYIDTSTSILVFNSDDEDVTASCVSSEGIYGKKAGFVFSSLVEGNYKIQLTSTVTASQVVTINVEVMGYPIPSELFTTSYYYSASTNSNKYTVVYSDIVLDDESKTASGNATLTVEGEGTITIPFTFEYNNGACTFVGPDGVDYSLGLDNNFELVFSYFDEFEEVEVNCKLDKVAYFTNNLVGTYTFAYNPNTESSEMKLITKVNQSGVYKFSILSGTILCVNINHSEVFDYLSEYDFYVGKFLGSGETEKLVTLCEGDEIMIYNQNGFNITLAITLEQELFDNFSGDYAFNAANHHFELEVTFSGTYKFTIDSSYVVFNVNSDEEPSFTDKDGMVGKFLGSGSNELEYTFNAGDKVVIENIQWAECNLKIEKI